MRVVDWVCVAAIAAVLAAFAWMAHYEWVRGAPNRAFVAELERYKALPPAEKARVWNAARAKERAAHIKATAACEQRCLPHAFEYGPAYGSSRYGHQRIYQGHECTCKTAGQP